MTVRTLGVTALLTVTGCATFDPQKGHDQVASLVQERIGARTGWDKGAPEAEEISRRVETLLQGGLTADRAVEIALLNNPSLQATYEELGVSQADLIEASTLENPTLDFSIGFPLVSGPLNEWEGGIVTNFLNLFLMPLRKSVAEEQFLADASRVAHEALGVAAEVKKEFVALQTREQLLLIQRSALEASEAAADLAQRQHKAGNITELELAVQRVTYEQARNEATETELSVITTREHLNRLLGLWGPRIDWKLAAPLAELPTDEPALERLESLAIRQRLDVAAARRQTALMARATEIARTWRFFGNVEVGVHGHQDADGPRLYGPTLTLELPLFHQRQGMIARLESEQRRSERTLAALSVDARSEVRTVRAELETARRRVVHLRDVILPLRDQVVEGTLLQYNGMQVGLYHLLDAKQEQLQSYRQYLIALQDYWTARAELERTVGGRLPRPTAPTTSSEGQQP